MVKKGIKLVYKSINGNRAQSFACKVNVFLKNSCCFFYFFLFKWWKVKKNKAVRIKSTRERRYSALKCSWEASHGVSIPGWLTAPIRAPRCNRDTHSVHTSLQRGCRFSNSAPILGFDSQQIVLTIIYMPSAIYKAECFKKKHKIPSNQKTWDSDGFPWKCYYKKMMQTSIQGQWV